LNSLCDWEVLLELLEDKVINESTLKRLCITAGGKKKVFAGGDTVHLDLEAFEELIDLIALLEEEEEVVSDELMERFMNALSGTDINVSTKKERTKVEIKVDVEEEDESELLLNVFENLAGQKTYVTPKDLLEWDIVLDLMGEGVLTNDLLKEKMAECAGYNGKGITLEGFDVFVDKLVVLYREIPNEDIVEDVVEGSEDEVEKEGEEDVQEEEDEDDGDEDEEYIDIDTELVFQEISNKRDFITYTDILNWDVFQQVARTGSGIPSVDEQLKTILSRVGLNFRDDIDINSFEMIVDELSEASNEDEDEDNQ